MAFIVKNYGDGSLGNVTAVTATINSYAAVTAINTNSITINTSTQITGTAKFVVGAKVLIHVSATKSARDYLGRWLLATITAVSGSTLTIDENPTTKLMPAANLSSYYVQAIAVAQYKNLTVSSGTTITPPVYSVTSYHGGIVALMCSEKLTFNGGHISLADRGIPVANTALRPRFSYEVESGGDTESYAGWENTMNQYAFALNSGDGAAFIIAKTLVGNTNSRIGNVSTYGAQFYRGHKNSVTYDDTAPTNITNIGGSSILIAAETISGFSTKMIAKYRNSASTKGQGHCRCYIASETKLRNDEGLYAYDVISTPSRLSSKMNIRSFGDGSASDIKDFKTQLNNYATITAISGTKVTYKNKTTTGLAPISAGALVMIHFNHKSATYTVDSGRFILAKVLSDNGSVLTLDTAPPSISVTNYAAQVVSIPQANNFTLTVENTGTPKFDGAQGGICAIAVKNTCNLSGGKLNVMLKGGGQGYGRAGLAYIGNAQDCDKLPIGQGHGSVFILAKDLTVNKNTRIGHTSTGSGNFAYRGGTNDGYGSGANGGSTSTYKGGYGSNGGFHTSYSTIPNNACQGAHVMIVADKITGFSVDSISTGGGTHVAGRGSVGWNGSTSYAGGYNGGTSSSKHGGGSSGWCFIYCNNAVEPTLSNIYSAT